MNLEAAMLLNPHPATMRAHLPWDYAQSQGDKPDKYLQSFVHCHFKSPTLCLKYGMPTLSRKTWSLMSLGRRKKIMVEQEMGVDKLGVKCNYHPYPSPLATFEDVVASSDLFMDTLKMFHASMGTKFKIPIVGGRDLDLHRLFVEVTRRGGVTKVLKDKKWKEITSVFSFPSSATNASFILREYYVSLLYHYEQTYLFKAQCWTPSPIATQGPSENTYPYPSPLATYEDVVASSDLFMDTLKMFHASMGTKFMIPIVGGRDLDLHRLFVEVTRRGGVTKILKDKRWKEITSVFSFPSSATSASFILRKYYVSLLYHYEQTYLFKAKCWTPSPTEPKATPAGSRVCGVIDGKFDSGYLVTQTLPNNHHQGAFLNLSSVKLPVTRRKKSEIRKRDPALPKTNWSGYQFFFTEQHAKLKPLYHGKHREIIRIIGEKWNKLKEPERAVYQEKALKDKERYKIEMEDYRERLRTGQIVRGATMLTDLNTTFHFETANSAHVDGNEMCSDMKSDKRGSSDEYESANKESKCFGECLQTDAELKNVRIEVMDDDTTFDLQTRLERNGENDNTLAEDGISVPIEKTEQSLSNNNAMSHF